MLTKLSAAFFVLTTGSVTAHTGRMQAICSLRPSLMRVARRGRMAAARRFAAPRAIPSSGLT